MIYDKLSLPFTYQETEEEENENESDDEEELPEKDDWEEEGLAEEGVEW